QPHDPQQPARGTRPAATRADLSAGGVRRAAIVSSAGGLHTIYIGPASGLRGHGVVWGQARWAAGARSGRRLLRSRYGRVPAGVRLTGAGSRSRGSQAGPFGTIGQLGGGAGPVNSRPDAAKCVTRVNKRGL